MITLSLDDAARQLSHLRDQLTNGESANTATLTEEGRPVLAVVPWNLYEILLENAQVINNPHDLLNATPDTRQQALTVAAARAESLYTDPDLLSFEAYGHDDLFDNPE